MAELKKYILVRANKKTGKVDKQLEGIGKAMLSLWALQNTPKNMMCVIAEEESGLILEKYIGTASGFPEVQKHLEAEEEYLELEVEEE